jgi:hypothetical protein
LLSVALPSSNVIPPRTTDMRAFRRVGAMVVGMVLLCAAPAAAQEEIKILDHLTKKESVVKGVIDSESPEGIKIKVGNDVKLIPAADIKHVLYKLSSVKGYEYNAPFTAEAKALEPATKSGEKSKRLAEARGQFEALVPKLAENPNAARFMQFKVLQIAVIQAKDDPTQIEPTINLLKAFKKEHDKSWEIVPALKLLAQMQEDKGDIAEARQTYLDLTKIPSLPKEMKQEADLLVAQLSLRSGKFDDAEKILDGLRTSLPATDPQRPFALLYLAQTHLSLNKLNDVEANLKTVLASSIEPAVKCLAHNTLGDYYRKKNMNEEAFWEYLRVDALYPQDRNEHAKALYYLWKLFAEVKKDKVKSQEYLDKLKLLDDTEYAKKASSDK